MAEVAGSSPAISTSFLPVVPSIELLTDPRSDSTSGIVHVMDTADREAVGVSLIWATFPLARAFVLDVAFG